MSRPSARRILSTATVRGLDARHIDLLRADVAASVVPPDA